MATLVVRGRHIYPICRNRPHRRVSADHAPSNVRVGGVAAEAEPKLRFPPPQRSKHAPAVNENATARATEERTTNLPKRSHTRRKTGEGRRIHQDIDLTGLVVTLSGPRALITIWNYCDLVFS